MALLNIDGVEGFDHDPMTQGFTIIVISVFDEIMGVWLEVQICHGLSLSKPRSDHV